MSFLLATISLVVPDYDEALAFYVDKLGFTLKEDTRLSESKRWVVVSPGTGGANILLAKAKNEAESASIGNQAGGRVFLFLETDNFDRDYEKFKSAGVEFLEKPRSETYGKVVVFKDPFGNKWDLIEKADHAHPELVSGST